MNKHWFLLSILLMLALPSASYAVSMGDMGGMGMGGTGMGGTGMLNEIRMKTENVGEVTFSHSLHGTSCNTCHPKLFKKEKNSNYAGMKAMERGKSCGACHNGRQAFSVTANCATCHAGDIVYKETGAGDVTFSHAAHTEMLGGCDSCHPDLLKAERGKNKATMEEMEKGASCGACHDGSMAFGVAEDCESCHQM